MIDLTELNRMHEATRFAAEQSPGDQRKVREWQNAIHNDWPAVSAELATLRTENLEWLRIARGYLDADVDSPEEHEWQRRMDDMRRGRAGIHTPIPIVEQMLADRDVWRNNAAALATLREFARSVRSGSDLSDMVNRDLWTRAALNALDAGTMKAGA